MGICCLRAASRAASGFWAGHHPFIAVDDWLATEGSHEAIEALVAHKVLLSGPFTLDPLPQWCFIIQADLPAGVHSQATDRT